MNKYAAYDGTDWKFDLEAQDEREALARAQAVDPSVSRVILTSEGRASRS